MTTDTSSRQILSTPELSDTPFTILGASGFIGSHLAAELTRRDIPHTCPARGDASVLSRPLGHVVYAVGMTADYADRPFETLEAHVGLLGRVLASGRFDSFVYLSSTRLYDGLTARVTEDSALSLNPGNRRHLFDLSKGLGEALCIHAARNARVARLSSVFSEDLDGTNYLHTIIRAAAGQDGAVLDTAPNLARDYVDVADVTDAIVAIALLGSRPIYNVASGENVTNGQILEQLRGLGGASVTLSRPAGTHSAPQVSIDALVADFGLRPQRLAARLPALFERAKFERTKQEASHGA